MSGSARVLSWMSGIGREALPDVWERLGGPIGWSGGPPKCLEVVGRSSRMSRYVREALLGGREALPDVWEWSGGPPGCPGVAGRLFWMSGSGREDLPDVCE